MAISKEDKHDVKTHMGKALANKVAKVTRDSRMMKKVPASYRTEKKEGSAKQLPARDIGNTHYPSEWRTRMAKKKAERESKTQQPVQVSKEYHNGKWQKVGFYEGKGGKMTIKPHKD
jgi:hypothetical protein